MISCTDKDIKDDAPAGDFSNTLSQEEIDGKRLTPEILFKFGRVDEMKISPDGTTVIYTVKRYDANTDLSHAWIYSLKVLQDSVPVNLTEGFQSCSNPAWIDNNTIAFLSKDNDHSVIWKMNADGTDKQVISNTDGDINGFGFSKSGNSVFYLKDVKLDQSTQDKYPDLPLAKGIIAEDLMYRHWDAWRDYAYSHIFVAGYSDGKIGESKDIMEGEKFDSPISPYFDISEISWSADGKKLAYTCKKLSGVDYAVSTNSDIYVYDINTGETVNITGGMDGYDKYPVFSPDGSSIAFMSMETPGYESDQHRLFVYNLDDRSMTYLTEGFDRDADNYRWSADGKLIYFLSVTNATQQIFEINVASRAIRQITSDMNDFIAIEPGSGFLVTIKRSMSMSPEIFWIETELGLELQLTFTNRNIYDAIEFGEVKERHVTTTDGKDMLVWVIYPPGFDAQKKYPALLYCQGGPQNALSQLWSYRWNFQIMAANNYIVVAPNRRGLPGFGKEWNEQISGDWGGQNMKDYLTAIDDISKEPYVDVGHLGAVGASYGGYSVMYLAGIHEKRFKAFIAHAGIFNLESESAATEEMFFVRHDMGGYFWDKPVPESYTKFSPHLNVGKWDTPIMFVAGANDFRIPYTESLQAFNAAKLRGIPAKLLFYPDENHWVTKPQNSIMWQREFFEWLDRWLKTE
jgi:dipeptidyl aminopeptidase/acylaminoacyl peptidase